MKILKLFLRNLVIVFILVGGLTGIAFAVIAPFLYSPWAGAITILFVCALMLTFTDGDIL